MATEHANFEFSPAQGSKCLSPRAPLTPMPALCVCVCLCVHIHIKGETTGSKPGLFTHLSALMQMDLRCCCTGLLYKVKNSPPAHALCSPLFSTSKCFSPCFLPRVVHVIIPSLFAQRITAQRPALCEINAELDESFGVFPESESARKFKTIELQAQAVVSSVVSSVTTLFKARLVVMEVLHAHNVCTAV